MHGSIELPLFLAPLAPDGGAFFKNMGWHIKQDVGEEREDRPSHYRRIRF